MAKPRYNRRNILSPLNPALHYVVFLALALLLIAIVAYVMQQTATDTRARLVCPQYTSDPVKLIEELSLRCPNGVKKTTDQNKCTVWVCNSPNPTISPVKNN